MRSKEKNITITIPSNILTRDIQAGHLFSRSPDSHLRRMQILPSQVIPNDWLSPTDPTLDAHGIGQCGALAKPYPIPLLSHAPGKTTVTAHSLCSYLYRYHNIDFANCQYFSAAIHHILCDKSIPLTTYYYISLPFL